MRYELRVASCPLLGHAAVFDMTNVIRDRSVSASHLRSLLSCWASAGVRVELQRAASLLGMLSKRPRQALAGRTMLSRCQRPDLSRGSFSALAILAL